MDEPCLQRKIGLTFALEERKRWPWFVSEPWFSLPPHPPPRALRKGVFMSKVKEQSALPWGVTLPSFCSSQGDFGVSAPADVHDSRHRRPAGVRVRQGLSVPGRPRRSPSPAARQPLQEVLH